MITQSMLYFQQDYYLYVVFKSSPKQFETQINQWWLNNLCVNQSIFTYLRGQA